MKRLLPTITAAALSCAALATSGAASASADDQSTADEAIARFNERMTEAGGQSSGPPDSTPVDPEEHAAENPGSECFGAFATALDAGGSIDGQTARANADHFTFSGDTGSDDVDAGVVIVDEDHADVLEEFIDLLGSDDLSSCLSEAFNAMLQAEAEAAEEMSGTALPEELGTIEIASDSRLGVGDASAHVRFSSEITYDGTTFVTTLDLYAAVTGRSLAAITVASDEEPASDFDALAELEALVDSL